MQQDFVLDGVNQAGLSFGYLYLPGEISYQTIPSNQDFKAVSYLDFGHWILGNFTSVDEVQKALKNIYVFSDSNAAIQNRVFPVHAAIHDRNGQGIVVEFINGEMRVHKHIGIMTNSPEYPWYIKNLRNYK